MIKLVVVSLIKNGDRILVLNKTLNSVLLAVSTVVAVIMSHSMVQNHYAQPNVDRI